MYKMNRSTTEIGELRDPQHYSKGMKEKAKMNSSYQKMPTSSTKALVTIKEEINIIEEPRKLDIIKHNPNLFPVQSKIDPSGSWSESLTYCSNHPNLLVFAFLQGKVLFPQRFRQQTVCLHGMCFQ